MSAIYTMLLLAQLAGFQNMPTGPVAVDVSVDRSEILAGEPVVATVRIVWPPEVRVPPLSFGDRIGDFEILNREVSEDREVENGFKERVVTLETTAFETGPLELGPIEIPWTGGESEGLQTVLSKPVPIMVKSVLPEGEAAETAEVRAVRPPREMPLDRTLLAFVGGGIFLFLLLVALAVLYFKRFCQPKEKQAPAPPTVDPDEEALRALAEMETSGMLERDTAKACYLRFSYILRRYLGRRHRFNALEMTSLELVMTLEQIGWRDDLWGLLDEDLRESDSVKFAKYVPDLNKRRLALGRVREIVLSTRPAATRHSVEEPLNATK